MKKRFTLFFSLISGVIVMLNLLNSRPLQAALTVDITQGQVAPTPIALAPLYGDDEQLAALGRQITDVVAADLERSGLFRPIDPRAFIQDLISLRGRPRFADWRVINAQILMKGELTRLPDGKIRAEFRLFDVIAENQMEAAAYMGDPRHWRRMAHKIADAIYKRVTGEDGYFDTQIVYVAETGPAKKRVKRLAIMDQDGANHRYLTNGQTLVLTPRFSPNMQQITYLDFAPGKAKAYLMDLSTHKKQLLGHFPGMTIAPRFSPDGRRMVLSASIEGSTNLYLLDLSSKATTRLTSDPVIDTSPSFSPDGQKICFNSDRSGKTQIYVMSTSGGAAERISFGDGSYRTPVWSPRGDLIAFTKITEGSFYIGVMRPDGSGERLLTSGWVVEDPSWAPNGRVLMFTRREPNGMARIYTIDLTGYNERVTPTPTDASAATWSPLIP
jgi:TolB protein